MFPLTATRADPGLPATPDTAIGILPAIARATVFNTASDRASLVLGTEVDSPPLAMAAVTPGEADAGTEARSPGWHKFQAAGVAVISRLAGGSSESTHPGRPDVCRCRRLAKCERWLERLGGSLLRSPARLEKKRYKCRNEMNGCGRDSSEMRAILKAVNQSQNNETIRHLL